jgi:integrase
MTVKLTDAVVRRLVPPSTGNKITYDTEIGGFGARITAGAAIAFVLTYRRKSDGLQRRFTIGQWPAWSVAAAREEAKALRRTVDSGGDPVGDRREQREAPDVHDLVERFRAEHIPKKAAVTQADYRRALVEIDRALGKLKVAAVAYRDLERLHAAITKRGAPVQANRTLSVITKAFALAVKWRWRPDNPARGIERNRETPRERYLTQDELRQLVAALEQYHRRTIGDFFLFLLLTGARVGETLVCEWPAFDLAAGVWTKPAHTTKTRQTHTVPLSGPAQALLIKIRNGQDGSQTRVFDISRRVLARNWEAICRLAGLADFHMHDLRHAHASLLINAGYSLPIVGKMLGHTQPRSTHRYAHLVPDTLAEAASAVGDIVTGTVVPINRGRRP